MAIADRKNAEFMGRLREAESAKASEDFAKRLVDIDKFYNSQVQEANNNSERIEVINYERMNAIEQATIDHNNELVRIERAALAQISSDKEAQRLATETDYSDRIIQVNDYYDTLIRENVGNAAKILSIEKERNKKLIVAEDEKNQALYELNADARAAELVSYDANQSAKKAILENRLRLDIISEQEYGTAIAKMEKDRAEKVLKIKKQEMQDAEIYRRTDIKKYKDAIKAKEDAEFAFSQSKHDLRVAEQHQAVQDYADEVALMKKERDNDIKHLELLEMKGTLSHKKATERKKKIDIDYYVDLLKREEQNVRSMADLYGKDTQEYEDAVGKKIDAEKKLEEARKKNEGGHTKTSDATKFTGSYITASENIRRAVQQVTDSTEASTLGFEAMGSSMRDTSSRAEELSSALAKASSKYKQFEDAAKSNLAYWGNRGTVGAIADQWDKVVRHGLEQLGVQRNLDRASQVYVSTLADIRRGEQTINGILSSRASYSASQLSDAKGMVRALQDQIYAQKKLKEEEQGSLSISRIQTKLEQARAEGVDIESYGFDKKSADRLQELESENKEIDAKIAKEEYAAYKQQKALEDQGATQAAIDAAKVASEKKISELRDQRKGNDLEAAALDASLNLEMINLKLINDLKIKNFEAMLKREQDLHDKRMKDIEEENKARLAGQEAALSGQGLPKYARGGRLPGNGTQDTVRVLARPGEWFIRNESANFWNRKFGSGFMQAINNPLSVAGRNIMGQLNALSNPILPKAQVSSISPSSVIQAFSSGGEVAPESQGPITRITLQSQSGSAVNATIEGGVNDFLSILEESGLRTV
jgi:hypothetical protein